MSWSRRSAARNPRRQHLIPPSNAAINLLRQFERANPDAKSRLNLTSSYSLGWRKRSRNHAFNAARPEYGGIPRRWRPTRPDACRRQWHRPQPWTAGCRPASVLDRHQPRRRARRRAGAEAFPPMSRDQFTRERTSLLQLRGRLGVPIPEIVVEGERDQWPYLVLTRLSGEIQPALADAAGGSKGACSRPAR